MKRFFQRALRSLSQYKQEAEVKVSPTIIEELEKPALGDLSYTPYLDEPSVFDLDPSKTSMVWIHWAQGRLRLSLDQAAERAEKHKRWLLTFPARKVNRSVVPDILINFTYRGVSRHALSLEWVMWYANAFEMSLQEAHEEGIFLTTRQPEGNVK